MKRLLALVCALGLTLLGGCAFLMKGEDTETQDFDYTEVVELARAKCVPEGARLISEEASRDGDRVFVVIEFEDGGKVYRWQAVFDIVETYQMSYRMLLSTE